VVVFCGDLLKEGDKEICSQMMETFRQLLSLDGGSVLYLR